MRVVNLPPARMRPPGSTTIGTTFDERTSMRDGMLLIAASCLLGGLAGGFILGRRSGRRSNPETPRRPNPRTALSWI